jgi:hypothetical protein
MNETTALDAIEQMAYHEFLQFYASGNMKNLLMTNNRVKGGARLFIDANEYAEYHSKQLRMKIQHLLRSGKIEINYTPIITFTEGDEEE